MKKPYRNAVQTLLAACLAGPLSAMAMAPVGSPVEKIPFVSSISTWQALDERRLVLSLTEQKSYLVTLTHSCRALPGASHVGVSASNNTVYAGFDYITADGERCAIKHINRLSKAQKQALIKA